MIKDRSEFLKTAATMSFHSLGNATKSTHLQMRMWAAKKVN